MEWIQYKFYLIPQRSSSQQQQLKGQEKKHNSISLPQDDYEPPAEYNNKCKSKVFPEEVKNKVTVEGKTSPGTEYNSVYSHSRKLNVSNPSWSREGKHNKYSSDQWKGKDSTDSLVYQNKDWEGLS